MSYGIASHKYRPRAICRPFGSGWWTERRNTTLMRIMRDYNDVAKAARVLGCPEASVVKQLRFLEHVMRNLPKADNDRK